MVFAFGLAIDKKSGEELGRTVSAAEIALFNDLADELATTDRVDDRVLRKTLERVVGGTVTGQSLFNEVVAQRLSLMRTPEAARSGVVVGSAKTRALEPVLAGPFQRSPGIEPMARTFASQLG